MGHVLVESAPALISGVALAALLGGVKWVRAVTTALDKLADVAAQLATVADRVDGLHTRLTTHEREAAVRWAQIGGAVHPRYLTEDRRVPAPAGASE